MKQPVFSGPSGRKPGRKVDYVRMGEQPKVGEHLEFAESPGVRHQILAIKDDRALINTVERGKHWVDISRNNRQLMTPEEIMATDAAFLSRLGGFKDALRTERLPLTYGAVESSGDKYDHTKAAVKQYNEELLRAKRDKAHSERELARAKIKNRGRREWSISNEEYQQDVVVVRAAVADGLKLQRPQGSSYHHMQDFLRSATRTGGDDEWWDEDFQSFIVESDWARALATGGGDEDGDFPLPYDYTCFEMRISGLRVLLLMGRDAGMLVTGVNRRWYINADVLGFVQGRLVVLEKQHSGGMLDDDMGLVDKMLDLVGSQVRAVCIALDERRVFEQVTVKAGVGLNKSRRARGLADVRDYHVVRLKPRAERVVPVEGYVRGPLMTWHKRRGHWRHYDLPSSGAEQYMDDDGALRSRTWIGWMFVGNMEGRFIDKEYRL
jgi:hypothetical protein